MGGFEKQKEYLEKLLTGLSKITGSGVEKKKKSEKEEPVKKGTPLEQANGLYKSKKYSEAKIKYAAIVDERTSAKDKAQILHNLGMCDFHSKNFEEAVAWFSRLYTDFPKSPFNKTGLYHLSKSLKILKKYDEAKQTAEELSNQYPDSVEAKELFKKN